MQVYIVPVEDAGDEWEVKGVYSTPELAEEARKFYASGMRPQEFALDYLPEHPVGKYLWYVHLQENGTVRCSYQVSGDADDTYFEVPYPSPPNSRFLRIWAKDAPEALELAQKRWKELTESGKWNKE